VSEAKSEVAKLFSSILMFLNLDIEGRILDGSLALPRIFRYCFDPIFCVQEAGERKKTIQFIYKSDS